MNFSIRIIIGLIITIVPLIGFCIENFTYSFSGDQHYKNDELIGNDLIVAKHYPDSAEEKEYWRIKPDHLPVTDKVCAEYTMDFCTKTGEECYPPCLEYGPQLITYAKNVKKIYFLNGTTAMGETGFGPRVLFVGDLDNKHIRYLTVVDAEVAAEFSPNEKYIIFYKSSNLNILNTLNDEMIVIKPNNIQTKKYKEVHDLDKIHWISNVRFTYYDTSYGFDKDPIKIMINTYDISEKKIISSKRIK